VLARAGRVAEIAEMFEDETIDIACPKCGHKNSLMVREVEAKAELHTVCESCKTGIKIEAREFQQHLDQLRQELEQMQRKARQESRKSPLPRTKDNFQI
jgi:hypothetical protein